MSSKHSKGPWHRSGANTIHSKADRVIVCYVGTADEEVREFNGERFEADAALIAAAPDLLEACEQALLWLGDGNPASNYPGDVVRGRMRAAIKKARGE